MFIREKNKTVKSKKYIQHLLIESIRTPAGPRQRLVLNLGFLDLHPDKWKELANTIESEVHKQPRLFVTDPQIKKKRFMGKFKGISALVVGERNTEVNNIVHILSEHFDEVSRIRKLRPGFAVCPSDHII